MGFVPGMPGALFTVNDFALVAVAVALLTVIFPVVPLPTVVVIELALTMVKEDAAVPPKATAVVQRKFVPVRVTTVPVLPLLGVKEVMDGDGGMTVKFFALLAVPPGVVTLIGPLVVPALTFALMLVLFTSVNVDAATPLNFTAEVLEKLLPLMLTDVNKTPLLGVNEVIVGG